MRPPASKRPKTALQEDGEEQEGSQSPKAAASSGAAAGASSGAAAGASSAAASSAAVWKEVGRESIAERHLPYQALVGSDVCVLAAAWPQEKLIHPSSLGWRAEILAVRGKQSNRQVCVFNKKSWFLLSDTERILPIIQEEG